MLLLLEDVLASTQHKKGLDEIDLGLDDMKLLESCAEVKQMMRPGVNRKTLQRGNSTIFMQNARLGISRLKTQPCAIVGRANPLGSGDPLKNFSSLDWKFR